MNALLHAVSQRCRERPHQIRPNWFQKYKHFPDCPVITERFLRHHHFHSGCSHKQGLREFSESKPGSYQCSKAAFHSPDNSSCCCWEILWTPVFQQVPQSCDTWQSFSSASTGLSELLESFLLLLKPCGTTHIIQWVEIILFTALSSKILPPQDRIKRKKTQQPQSAQYGQGQYNLDCTQEIFYGTGQELERTPFQV